MQQGIRVIGGVPVLGLIGHEKAQEEEQQGADDRQGDEGVGIRVMEDGHPRGGRQGHRQLLHPQKEADHAQRQGEQRVVDSFHRKPPQTG